MKQTGDLNKLPADKLQAVYLAGLREFASKPFSDASTDVITSQGGISKGLLFHYFGSKKDFYLYCLKRSMDTLTAPTDDTDSGDFYDILFDTMNAKFSLCMEHMLETRLVNMASRDASREIAADKSAIMRAYALDIRRHSEAVMTRAVSRLRIREDQKPLAQSGLTLYASALMNKYLLAYQERPEDFFRQSDRLKKEFRDYIDLMLKGIEKEDNV